MSDYNDPFGFVGLTYDDVLLLPGHTQADHQKIRSGLLQPGNQRIQQ